jgi:hypothetical protein
MHLQLTTNYHHCYLLTTTNSHLGDDTAHQNYNHAIAIATTTTTTTTATTTTTTTTLFL